MARRSAAVVETLEEDDDLELVTETKPARKSTKKATAKAAPAPREDAALGASWLATYVNQEIGTDFTPAQVRVILRKMAADGSLAREVGTDRSRYAFTGENDRTVKAFIKRVQANPDEVKSNRANRIAEARKPAATKKARKAAAPVEELEEAPAPKATRKRRA
jgi:hypothetical protein